MKTLLAMTTLASIYAAGISSAATISTLPDENAIAYPWGLPDTAAYGQTFTFGQTTKVNDITFRIDDYGTAIDFAAYLYAWDGSKATGSALAMSLGTTVGSAGMESIVSSLGGATVAAGQYVIFLQATSNFDPDLGTDWGVVDGDVYAGGSFVFQNNGGDLSKVGTEAWQTFESDTDAAFALTYENVAPVPLPAGLPLALTAFAALGVLGARRNRRAD